MDAHQIGSMVGAVGVGVPVVYMLLKNELERRKTVRTLRARQPLDAGEAGHQVFAIGNVRPAGELLAAPITDRPCVAYRTRFYVGTFDSYASSREQIGVTRFELVRRDGSVVEIDATHARFCLPALPIPPGLAERCKAFATAKGFGKGHKRISKYEEVVVLEGMRLAISGTLATAPGTEPARLTGDEKSPIIIGVPF